MFPDEWMYGAFCAAIAMFLNNLLSETSMEVSCLASSFVSSSQISNFFNLLHYSWFCFKDIFYESLVDVYVLGCMTHRVFIQKMAVLIHIFQLFFFPTCFLCSCQRTHISYIYFNKRHNYIQQPFFRLGY